MLELTSAIVTEMLELTSAIVTEILVHLLRLYSLANELHNVINY